MKIALRYITFLALLVLIACDRQMSRPSYIADGKVRVQQVLDKALRGTNITAKVWQEFLDTWPGSVQRRGMAFNESVGHTQGNISAAAPIEGRYVLKLIIDYSVDSTYESIAFTNLRLHFAEVKRVVVPPEGSGEGGVSVIFQPDQKMFSTEDWDLLRKSGMDFSVLGLKIMSNAPIKNIETALNTF
jgi:hypothetical protein